MQALLQTSVWRRRAVTHGPRLLRFGLVGLSGVVVNTIVLTVLVELGHVAPFIASLVATEAAILSNFFLNDIWTFRDPHRVDGRGRRLARYNIVALVGLAISLAVFSALTYGFGVFYLAANFCGIAVGLLWNYAGSIAFTWRKATTQGDSDSAAV